MIMRITWGKLRPGTWNDYEQAYKTSVVASGVRIGGLRARWLAQDSEDPDAGVVISLWDSLVDVRAYEQSDFFQNVIQASVRPFFVGDYHTSHCEVKFAEQGL